MRVCPKNRWTSTDIEILHALFPEERREIIHHAFPNRTWHAIEIKAGRLGIKRSKMADKNVNWKGEKATPNSARERARRRNVVPRGYEIHHIDSNPYNNKPENIQIVTRKEHMILDGRLQNLKQYKGGM